MDTIEKNLWPKHFNKPDPMLKNLILPQIKKVKGTTKQQREVKEQKNYFQNRLCQ